MRPIYHPSLEEITVQGILYALSDPVRVRICGERAQADCAMNCSAFLSNGNLKLPKSTLSLHFKALREAGLIRSERRGVEMHNTSRCVEVEQRFPGLIAAIVHAHNIQSQQNPRARVETKRKPATRNAKSKPRKNLSQRP